MPVSATERPWYLLFAGVNGAGKSTLFHSNLWALSDMPRSVERVNADEILVEQGGDWRKQADQIRAGREAIRRIRAYLFSGTSFNQESTLSGKTVLHTIQEARDLGYRVLMHYVGVQSPQIANARIAHRLDVGGHSIAEDVVERRWQRSMDNFVRAASICDEVLVFDNTWQMRLVARLKHGILASEYPCDPNITWHRELLARL